MAVPGGFGEDKDAGILLLRGGGAREREKEHGKSDGSEHSEGLGHGRRLLRVQVGVYVHGVNLARMLIDG